MPERIHVSIDDDHMEFIEARGLSPSKILQNALDERMGEVGWERDG